jgi:hypothetical protein
MGRSLATGDARHDQQVPVAQAPVPLASLTPNQRRVILALIEAGRVCRPLPEIQMAAAAVRMTAAAGPEVRGDVAASAP